MAQFITRSSLACVQRGVFVALALGVGACDDGPSAEEPTGSQDARVIAGDGAVDSARVDSSDGAGGESGGADGAGGGAGEVGDAGAGECIPSDQRCLTEGDPFIQTCRGDERWTIERCPDEGVCLANRCAPNPNNCTEGQRICVDSAVPGECVPGQGWVRTEPCSEDTVCFEGTCQSRECALAARNRSYLGCDYLAVELPNSTFQESNESTPDAPVGVVLANSDLTRPTVVTVLGPDGQVAALLDEVTVDVPLAVAGEGYTAQTVRSQVRDAQGNVVGAALASADELEIPAGGIATLLLPHRPLPPAGQSFVRTDAYRLKTSRPVAAYQFSPYCCNFSFSNDASLLIPTTALGTEYKFLGVPSWSPQGLTPPSLPAALVVVAAEDGTQVIIDLPRQGQVLADSGGRITGAGARRTARLAAGEVMYLQSAAGPGALIGAQPQPDLTGARVVLNKPAAVFSSHECAFYPQLLGACDHLEEQLFPVDTWGGQFELVPPKRRGDGAAEVIYWKIIAKESGARVQLSRPFAELNALAPGFAGVPNCATALEGTDTIVLTGESFCEFGTQEPVRISSTIPLMVMGIIGGQETTGTAQPFGSHAGDPSIFLLPPEQQYRSDYAFLVPDTYYRDYVTVVVEQDAWLVLDEEDVDLSGATPIPGSNRVFTHLEVADGAHRLSGSRPFSILVVAYDDFVSYAFTGGLNLEKR